MDISVADLRKKLFRAFPSLEKEQPIDPDHPYYVPLFVDGADPILRMHESIGFSDGGSMQLFSGCRGSGKSTQLRRLAELLRADGYLVVYVDALEYFHPAQPIDAKAVPVILGAMLSVAVEDDTLLGKNPARRGFFSRMFELMKTTDVVVDELDLKAGADTGLLPGGSVEAGFKMRFRTTESYREKIATTLAGRESETQAVCHKFFQETHAALKAEHADNKGCIFIVDALEQIRGDVTNSAAVIESVLHLFTNLEDLLHLPLWHAVYTVPPWLHIAYPGSVKHSCFLPTLKLWEYAEPSAKEKRHEDGWKILRQIVARRVGVQHMDRVFAKTKSGKRPVLEHLIEFSGGHLRDLFTLVSTSILASRELPIPMSSAEAAVSQLTDIMPVTDRDSLYLREVRRTRDRCLPDRETATITKFAQLTDFHLVLEYRNGKTWFDIHPAIRDAVERTASQTANDPRRLEAATR